MAVDTVFHLKVAPTLTASAGLATATVAALFEKTLTWASGVGANQADKVYQKSAQTIAGSSTTSLDLAGSLVDDFGATITMARVKAIAIFAYAANPNDIQFTRPAANGVPVFGAASDYIVVRPGGLLFWTAPDATGVAVTAGTGDLLSLVNPAAGTVTYDIVILGASA